ncbi:unnamed protein product [Aphanomyces euteiches]|uniref:Uncharacterized protein n=1 Tax=Aphanomyces euteiches TaxID=100861 RepID=A0A6G0XDH4_9STRA|nr:hypothetical protein Ae201684_006190 [Aphanomyces euteiches]KAH9068937.1 hypothetical protein Ae201684P_004634 [Aphanomyces euteiches]KAH9145843.1 hypothetical protein AeRB84_010237 [Aphanomyces euteiches]
MSSKLADHFKKTQKTPQPSASSFQFGFNVAPEAPSVPAKEVPPSKKKEAKSNPQPDSPSVEVNTASAEATASTAATADKKKKKKKKKKKPTKAAVPEQTPVKTDFEFLFTFDKVGFSEEELADMAPTKKPSKKAAKKSSAKTPAAAVTAPPPVPTTGSTNYLTLRKATDNSSEVQKMQLRYGKGKRIHTPGTTVVKKKPSEATKAAGSTFKFNF